MDWDWLKSESGQRGDALQTASYTTGGGLKSSAQGGFVSLLLFELLGKRLLRCPARPEVHGLRDVSREGKKKKWWRLLKASYQLCLPFPSLSRTVWELSARGTASWEGPTLLGGVGEKQREDGEGALFTHRGIASLGAEE